MTDLAEMKQLALAAKRFGDEITPEFVADLIQQVGDVPDWNEVDTLVQRVWQSGNLVDCEPFLGLVRLIASPEVCADILEQNEKSKPWDKRSMASKEAELMQTVACTDCKAPALEPCTGDSFCQARLDDMERYKSASRTRKCGGKGCTGGSCPDCENQPTRIASPDEPYMCCGLGIKSVGSGLTAQSTCVLRVGHAGECRSIGTGPGTTICGKPLALGENGSICGWPPQHAGKCGPPDAVEARTETHTGGDLSLAIEGVHVGHTETRCGHVRCELERGHEGGCYRGATPACENQPTRSIAGSQPRCRQVIGMTDVHCALEKGHAGACQ